MKILTYFFVGILLTIPFVILMMLPGCEKFEKHYSPDNFIEEKIEAELERRLELLLELPEGHFKDKIDLSSSLKSDEYKECVKACAELNN